MKNEKKNDNFEEHNPEALRFENELLKLKLQAQFGAAPVVVSNKLPPEIENAFLKNIFKIEQSFATRDTVSLFDKAGQPPTVNADELDDVEIEAAYLALEDTLTKKGIFITFSDRESYRNRYFFITEKLFKQQIDNLDMPDMSLHFDCLDFDDEMDEDVDDD